jgi:hypothetical protein
MMQSDHVLGSTVHNMHFELISGSLMRCAQHHRYCVSLHDGQASIDRHKDNSSSTRRRHPHRTGAPPPSILSLPPPQLALKN